jgi:catechol-2,3-dioxygenase
LNIWNSSGSQPAAENAGGLMSFEITTASERLGRIADRMKSHGGDLIRPDTQKHRIVDPDGISLDLSVLNNKGVI